MKSAGTIITSMVVATGLTELNLLLKGTKSFRPVISGFVVGSILLLLAFVSVEVATMLALMILLASVMYNIGGILERTNG